MAHHAILLLAAGGAPAAAFHLPPPSPPLKQQHDMMPLFGGSHQAHPWQDRQAAAGGAPPALSGLGTGGVRGGIALHARWPWSRRRGGGPDAGGDAEEESGRTAEASRTGLQKGSREKDPAEGVGVVAEVSLPRTGGGAVALGGVNRCCAVPLAVCMQ